MKKARMSTLPLLLNTELEIYYYFLKEIKNIQIEKEEIKFFVFSDDMIHFIEDPKKYIHTTRLICFKISQDTSSIFLRSISYLYVSNIKTEN